MKPVALPVWGHKEPALLLPPPVQKILLLWHKGPLYPGAQSQVPSSGEQEPPFSQLQEMEQFGPQRPWVQILSQWMPEDKKPHVRFHTAQSAHRSKKHLAARIHHRGNKRAWQGNSSSFIIFIKWKLGKWQTGEFCRCQWAPDQCFALLKKLCMSAETWRSGIALKSQNVSNNWSGNMQLIEAWLRNCCEMGDQKKKNQSSAKTCSVCAQSSPSSALTTWVLIQQMARCGHRLIICVLNRDQDLPIHLLGIHRVVVRYLSLWKVKLGNTEGVTQPESFMWAFWHCFNWFCFNRCLLRATLCHSLSHRNVIYGFDPAHHYLSERLVLHWKKAAMIPAISRAICMSKSSLDWTRFAGSRTKRGIKHCQVQGVAPAAAHWRYW